MKDVLKINIGFRYSEIDLLEQLNSNISGNNKPHLAIRRLLWFYIKFEDIYANEVPFQRWLKENPDAYLKSDNVKKFYQVKITAPDEIELLERAGSKNISKFIKYLIDTEEKITNIIISKVKNNNDEHVHYLDSDNNIPENSSSIKVNERISEVNEAELEMRNEENEYKELAESISRPIISTNTEDNEHINMFDEPSEESSSNEEDEIDPEALEAARKSFGNLFN